MANYDPKDVLFTIPQPTGKAAYDPKDVLFMLPNQRKTLEDIGSITAGAISVGQGIESMGQAVGLLGPTDPNTQVAMDALRREHPTATRVGRTVGQALPFAMIPNSFPSAIARIGVGGVLGAAEGALISKAENQDIGTGAVVGGVGRATLEAIMPPLLKLGGRLISTVLGRAPKGAVLTAEGLPTPELQAALDKAGLSFDDLSEEAYNFIKTAKPGTDVEQLARAANFKDAGIPALKGDVTQKTADRAFEAKMVQSTEEGSELIKAVRSAQSSAYEEALQKNISRTGVSEQTGNSIKNVIESRKTLLSEKKTDLYKRAAAEAKTDGIDQIPIIPDRIRAAIPDTGMLYRVKTIKTNNVASVQAALAEFGIDTSKKAKLLLAKRGVKVKPLTIENFDDFRTALNQAARADKSGATEAFVHPIREALDYEASDIVGIAKQAGLSGRALDTLLEARKTVTVLKTELDPHATLGRLIAKKPGTIEPVVEASQVYNDIVGPNKPIERLQRVVNLAQKMGVEGREAIGNLQAATLTDIMEAGFKAETRKGETGKLLGTVPFVDRINQIGENKLKLIFSTRPDIYRELRQLESLAKDLTMPAGIVSTKVPKKPMEQALYLLQRTRLLSVLATVSGVPGVNKAGASALLAESIGTLLQKQGNKKAIAAAIAAKPEIKSTVGFLQRQMPSFAAALGIADFAGDQKKWQE